MTLKEIKTVKEIQGALEEAYHEIGHAYAFAGTPGRDLEAYGAVDRARDSIQLVHDALKKRIA